MVQVDRVFQELRAPAPLIKREAFTQVQRRVAGQRGFAVIASATLQNDVFFAHKSTFIPCQRVVHRRNREAVLLSPEFRLRVEG